MDYVAQIAQKTCQEILEFDTSIRFVGISQSNGKFLAGAFNANVEYLVDKEEYKRCHYITHTKGGIRGKLYHIKLANPYTHLLNMKKSNKSAFL